MIGIKDQCFGVEIELTGITRAEAAEALAAYFETTPQRSYDNYDSWYVPDREGKQWRIMSDGSIRAEWNDDGHYRRTTDPEYRVEMVTPKLTYEEMEKFQECVRRIRQAGGKVNDCVVITIQEVNMRWGVFASEQIHFCDNTIESCDNRHFVIPLSDPNISRYRDNVKRCYKRGR